MVGGDSVDSYMKPSLCWHFPFEYWSTSNSLRQYICNLPDTSYKNCCYLTRYIVVRDSWTLSCCVCVCVCVYVCTCAINCVVCAVCMKGMCKDAAVWILTRSGWSYKLRRSINLFTVGSSCAGDITGLGVSILVVGSTEIHWSLIQYYFCSIIFINKNIHFFHVVIAYVGGMEVYKSDWV